MKVRDVIFTKGVSAFYFDDQKAIKGGAGHDGFAYTGDTVTPGFYQVRIPGETVSVILILEDGQKAFGDCCAVQYSGAGGRDPLFLADEYIPWMDKHLKPELIGRDIKEFKANAEYFDSLKNEEGDHIHTAIRYGVSQALLHAASCAQGVTVTEIIASEYGLDIVPEPVRIFGQTGDDRYMNADKMIIKQVDVLPHALINNVEEKVGADGEKLGDYVKWLSSRVLELRADEAYTPEFHIDVYGTLGIVFKNDLQRIAEYLEKLKTQADPFILRIEGPVDMGEREAQADGLSELTELMDKNGCGVEIVADEWCNTLEDIDMFARQKAGHMLQIKTPDLGSIHNTVQAVIDCNSLGVKAYQGGTCNETDQSARICTQAALATRPYQILAKPGMGFDEGYMIVKNEMERTISLLMQNAECGVRKNEGN